MADRDSQGVSRVVRARQFPANLIAGMFKFEPKVPFEATPEAAAAPKVDFNSTPTKTD